MFCGSFSESGEFVLKPLDIKQRNLMYSYNEKKTLHQNSEIYCSWVRNSDVRVEFYGVYCENAFTYFFYHDERSFDRNYEFHGLRVRELVRPGLLLKRNKYPISYLQTSSLPNFAKYLEVAYRRQPFLCMHFSGIPKVPPNRLSCSRNFKNTFITGDLYLTGERYNFGGNLKKKLKFLSEENDLLKK